MKDSVRKINNIILERYAELCSILREEPLSSNVNTFGEWEECKAEHWLAILNNSEFATLSIDKFTDNAGVDYYAPILIYSDGVDVVRESFTVE